jgi:hypothetical protein
VVDGGAPRAFEAPRFGGTGFVTADAGIGLGVLLVLFVGVVSVANVVAARFARESPLARRLSWLTFALVVASTLSLLYTMVTV